MSEYIKPKVSPVPMQVIHILGTPYTIKEQSEKQNPKLKNADGICEQYSKEIVLVDYLRNPTDVMTVENAEEYRKKVLRHEIIHAFLGESGLRCSSEWAENEEMVDWFAIQFEKIYRAFVEAGALEDMVLGVAETTPVDADVVKRLIETVKYSPLESCAPREYLDSATERYRKMFTSAPVVGGDTE